MSDKTGIEWADATWNPVTGCTKVSEGCRNCYAKTFAERFKGTPGHYFESGFEVTLRPDKLDQPLRWQKPRRIFVNSMSDLFHESIDEKYIAKVFAIMWLCQQHTFQVLTKRPARMAKLLNDEDFQMHIGWFASQAVREYGLDPNKYDKLPDWPNPNIWLGISAENQETFDSRWPYIAQTPASVRFVSAEPLLGELDVTKSITFTPFRGNLSTILPKPDWIIAGGESGHKARPMHPEWARSLRDQCQAAGVPFFFKQWGEWMQVHPDREPYEYSSPSEKCTNIGDMRFYRVGKKKAGRLLDRREWNEFPEVKV